MASSLTLAPPQIMSLIATVVSEPGQEKAQNASTTLEHLAWLDIYSEPSTSRKTHIICTIGPSSRSVDTLVELMKAGMTVVRMNFSHGTHEYHGGTVALAREAAAKFGAPIAIALDTKGPEIRTGLLEGFAQNPKIEIELKAGQSLTLSMDEANFEKCNENLIYIDYKNMCKVVKPGNKIFMDDGLIGLLVEETGENFVKTKVINSGLLGSKKGVNIPGVDVDLPALSPKDKDDLLFGLEQGVDMIFASFIRSRQDVIDIRAVLGDKGSHIKIISKIENHQGVRHFDEILEESDGIMVARGDLGIEIPTEKVFLAQKMMIARSNLAGKPVICATQMLESMVHAPRPTRAESSDVANAVIDGADCVMLSGETAKGDYPVEAVKVMANICREAEDAIFYRHFREELRALTKRPTSTTETCAVAAVDASMANDAKAIICLTISGRTARLISKWRPRSPIISVTRNASVARQNQLLRGVVPVVFPKEKLPEETWAQDVDNRFFFAMEQGKAAGILQSGDKVIGVHGWQSGPGHTNTVRILLVQ